MHIGHLLTVASLRSSTSNEGDRHLNAKASLATLLDCPGLTKVFTCGDHEVRVSGDVSTATEVGWPKVLPRCTYESYRLKRGEPPEYIFDIGVFRDLELIGVVEVCSSSVVYQPKVAGILKAGLWLAEVSTSGLREALRADRPAGVIHIQCAKVVAPWIG